MSNEWIDLTKDQNEKICKKIIRPGEIIEDITIKKTEEELRPKKGDCVKVKLVAKTEEDSNVFLDYFDKPIEFNLFTGENIRGLDLVISTMIKGELCDASISAKYVNGDLFYEDKDKIPRNRRLNYTIELIDWENEYLSRKNDGGVIRKVLNKKGIGYEVPVIYTMVTVNLIGFYETRSADNQLTIHKFDERSNLKFKLGEGCELGIVRGVEYAIYRMKINEKNRVYVEKKYTFDRDCNLENLEQDLIKHQISNINKLSSVDDFERLIYEVELISFENKKQIWELSNYQRFEECKIEKQRAAEFFKKSKFYLSLKCYSEILKLIGPPNTLENLTERQMESKDEIIVNAYNNMTVCYLRLKMAKEAIKYADWALEIDPKNTKALYRKGLANYDRNDFKQSIELFNQVLELDPRNEQARNQINLAQKQIKIYEDKEKQIFSNLFQALAK